MNKPGSYNGNPKVKADGVETVFTEHEVNEYLRCMEDVPYFCENYIKVINLDHGLVPFKLRGYQTKMVDHFSDNRFNIVLACRQSGKSITSVAWILHYVIFNPDKKVGLLANKGAIAREMLARLTLMLENLPFFLQPGVRVLNKGNIVFSNNSEVLASATSGSSIRGLSLNCLFLDEFGFVNKANEFYTSTYPVISSGADTKVIISSTPNGVGNMFYKLWEGAKQGSNEFKPFTIKWRDVPGRDEAWRAQTIANSSEAQFRQEFECEFLGSSATLIDSNSLLGLSGRDPIKTQHGIEYYREPEEGHSYILTADVSKGRGQDYSTFSVIDVTSSPFKQVCTYRNNMISPLLFPASIIRAAKVYNDALVIVENNDAGMVVCNAIYYDYEYENTFTTSTIKSNGIGVTMTKKVKRIGCSNLKDLLEAGKLEVFDRNTISELSTFEPKGDSYAASAGTHDDSVMNLVLFSWFVSTDIFSEMTNLELKDLLYQEKLLEMESDVTPFGYFPSSSGSASEDVYSSMVDSLKEWQSL
jgi:hypothetical protein